MDPTPEPDAARHEPPVVVTGGSGMLGGRLIARLRREFPVVSLDLVGDPETSPDVEFICTDLTSDSSVHRAFERIRALYGDRITSIVHLAAYYDFAGAPSPLYEKVTVEGTERILRAARDFDVDQFVFSSTMLVHEPTAPGRPIDEDAAIEATWPYPKSKVETEERIDETAPGDVDTVVVRLAGVYDEDGHSPPITNQILRIHGRWLTSHFYPASPERGQAFVHLDDAVDALVRVVESRDRLASETELLVGEPETVGYGELQNLIARALHGEDWRTWPIPKPVARLGAWAREVNPFGRDPFIRSWMVDRADDHYELDIGRAEELIGWKPRHRVRDVIPEMIGRLRDDPEGWYAENGLEPPRRAAA